MTWAATALTAALVAITAYYAWQNQRMVAEMRQARALSVRPHLIVQLTPVGPTTALVDVVNVGQGPALDVDFTLTFEPVDGTTTKRVSRHFVAQVFAVGHSEQFFTPEWPEHPTTLMDMATLAARYKAIALQGSMTDAMGDILEIRHGIADLPEWQRLTGEAAVVWEENWRQVVIREVEKVRKTLEGMARTLDRRS